MTNDLFDARKRLDDELFDARKRLDDAGKGLSHDEQSEILSIAEKNCSIEALTSKTVQEKLRELDSYHGRAQGIAGQYAGSYVIFLGIRDKLKQLEEMVQLSESLDKKKLSMDRHYDQLEANEKANDMIALVVAIFVFGFIFILLFSAWQDGLL